MKEWTLVGVPLCVYAVTALGKAEQERRERLGFTIKSPPESELAAFPEHRYVFVYPSVETDFNANCVMA
jgi:hypothetical protein